MSGDGGPGAGTGAPAGKVPPRPGSRQPSGYRPPPARTGAYATGHRPPSRGSARQLAHRRQRNIYVASGVTAVVVVLVGALIVVSLSTGGNGGTGPKAKTAKGSPPEGTFAISQSLVKQVENVPLATLLAGARAKTSSSPADIYQLPAADPPLEVGGKPEVLFIGAEWCPYCAAERWSLLMALSKFGTFGPLRGTTSSSTDAYSSTPSFSFYGTTYTSKYLAFVPVEEQTNNRQPLQSPTAAQETLFNQYDAPPYVPAQSAGSYPFVYLDGKYLLIGAQYVPSAIAGMPFDTAVSYLTSGTNATSKAAEASAGTLVGMICAITKDQPPSVCAHVPAPNVPKARNPLTGQT